MQSVARIVFAIMLVIVLCATAVAWEFTMTGEGEWRYRYISRTGPHDLFGNAETAQKTPGSGTSIGLTGPNVLRSVDSNTGIVSYSPGVLLEGYSSKGSDASYAAMRFSVFPELIINPALSVRAVIGFHGNLNGPYVGGENWASNAPNSGWIMLESRNFVTGSGLAAPILEALWVKAHLPLGTVVFGQRPAGFGMGWLMHENDMYSRSLSLIAPYGPLSFVFSVHPQNLLFRYTDPGDQRNLNRTNYTIVSSPDKNQSAVFSQSYSVMYRDGNLDAGVMLSVLKTPLLRSFPQPWNANWAAARNTYRDDLGPYFMEGFLLSAHLNDPNEPITGEGFFTLGASYLKYSTGSFFLNGEYDWQTISVQRNGGRPISGFTQAWAAEVGAIAGPAKLSLAGFYRSGHDRRGGVFNSWSPTGAVVGAGGSFAYDQWNHFLSWWGGGDAPIRPYNLLLSMYGTGNNSFNSSGTCTFEDFLGLGGRLDYALAANLNVFASFLKAYRASGTSTSVGLYDGVSQTQGFFPVRTPNPAPGAPPIPNVSSTDLGWETDFGLNWKLLEGLTFNCLFAYWQPGDWFKGAYRDMTFSNPTANTNPWWYPDGTVNQTRGIDPLIAFQSSILITY